MTGDFPELRTAAAMAWEELCERRRVPRTPLLESVGLSQKLSRPVLLKLENMQRSGSFKFRPALFSILCHIEEARERGVVTASSGNFAGAVALAAHELGVRATIVMRPSAARNKRERVLHYGADVVTCPDDYEERERTVARLVMESGALRLHPHDSLETVAGDTTVGRELLDDGIQDADVLVPCSGAGLLGGVAFTLAGTGNRVHGVQPVANGTLKRSLELGKRTGRKGIQTIADGLTAAIPGNMGFELARQFTHGVHTVSEEALLEATRLIWSEEGLVVEPAGAAGLAAALERPRDSQRPLVLVVTGRNVDLDRWADWMSG